MLPDRVSNPGPLTYESGALPIALRGPAPSGYTFAQKVPGSLVCKKASLTEYPACYSNLEKALPMFLENV